MPIPKTWTQQDPSPESLAEIPEVDFSKAKVLGRGRYAKRPNKKPLVHALENLRRAVGLTQAEVGAAAEMGQAEVSRLENGRDVLLSTLRRYVNGCGLELELVAVDPKTGHRRLLKV